jgi:small subunit ribosomal protein S6
MANRYETVFILTPVLSEQQAKETVKGYKKLLKDAKSKMVHEEDWGLRKLAYPIQKKSTGFYYLFEHETEGDYIATMETQFKRDEKVIRFLTVKMDKHHIAFAESRRDRSKNKKVETEKE